MYPNSTISAISELLFIDSNAKNSNADLAIVFGNDWIETMDEVYKLYIDGKIKKILITGHSANKDKEPEALRFKKRAIELGIPDNIILVEKVATNTKENFLFSKTIIENEIGFDNIKSILLVCKTFHTRRVLMTAMNFFPNNIDYTFLPMIDERNIQKDNWWHDDIAKTRVLEELRRISDYTLKGDLSLE